MKLLIVCPIPIEFNACRSVFMLKDIVSDTGKRAARGVINNNEIYVVESGPTKARAAAETVAAIYQYKPNVVLDTGCCGGLSNESVIGEVIVDDMCYEYDISGSGLPRRRIKEMKLPSSLFLLREKGERELVSDLIQLGHANDLIVRYATQLSGEFIIQSSKIKRILVSLFQARGVNWETAGVFIAALKMSLPPLSVRIVSDLANSNALYDFRRNARRVSLMLYGYIKQMVESGWFDTFFERWESVDSDVKSSLSGLVYP